MKVKELIEQLTNCNQDAEIGFEHLKIEYVSNNGDYVDLGGNGTDNFVKDDFPKEVFIVRGQLVEINKDTPMSVEITREVNGVFDTYEKAKKNGEWLISLDEFDGKKYMNYKIENFIVL